MSDLESRIRRIEDRIEITDLTVRYFIASDDDDYDTLYGMFAREGSFGGALFSGGDNRDEVAVFMRSERKAMGATVHTPNYTLIDFVDDDHASGIVGAHIELARGGTTMFGAVRYHDEYVREDGRWRFASRKLLMVHMGPWADVATSLTEERNIRWPGVEPLSSQFPKKKTP